MTDTANGAPLNEDINSVETVSFKLPATPRIGGLPGSDALLRIVDTFAPSQPVRDPAYFTGRTKQLEQLVCSIEEHRNHILIYGPRGSGKTSLVLTLLSKAQEASYTTIYLTCSRSSTFESIFRSALNHIPRRFDMAADNMSDVINSTFADLLPQVEITPQLVGELLTRITGTRIIIALDEFELNSGAGLATEIVELMKNVSDHGAPAHLLLIGAGSSSEKLLGRQDSIPRSLFRLKLTHMADNEVSAVITRLSKAADLEISREALSELVAIAQGKLFAAKLIALRAARSAAINETGVISVANFYDSVNGLCEHFNSKGFAEIHNVIQNRVSLQIIFRAIVRTIRELGDYFSVDQVATRCEHDFGSQWAAAEKVELILKTLAETKSIIVESDRNGTQLFHFADPNIEFAVAVLAYQASLVRTSGWAKSGS